MNNERKFNISGVGGPNRNEYSAEAKELVKQNHREQLALLIEKYGKECDSQMYKFFGYRLDEERSQYVLECNVSEEAFRENPAQCLREVLLYSAGAQYYYDNEKEY